MLWLAAAASSKTAPDVRQAGPTVAQAQAIVRIVSGVRLKLDSDRNEGAPPARATIFVRNGVSQPARLIEFE